MLSVIFSVSVTISCATSSGFGFSEESIVWSIHKEPAKSNTNKRQTLIIFFNFITPDKYLPFFTFLNEKFSCQ